MFITLLAMDEHPLVLSMSQADELDTVDNAQQQTVNDQLVQLGLKGITVLAASGDGGVCGVMDPCKDEHLMFPSCSEFITSVGGTNGFKVWKQYGEM